MKCAIYARKSADERAESQLASTDRQRELCEAYIASQADQGWTAIAERYDDVGYSGGNLKRPALRQLIADVEAGQVNAVVVYKIDRLSRSLKDFVGLVERFEALGVVFVAITQAFDTGSSMGRLTLNVLLSFAQFERELTSERLKDWFAGARERGLWQGPAPYGYDVARGVMTINPAQATIIRYMFRRYIILGSAKSVADEVTRMGAVNTRGSSIDGYQVMRILRNRLYLGVLPHKGTYVPGKHEPIVSPRQWKQTHAAIDAMRNCRRPRQTIPPEAPLYPLLHDRNGAPMIHMVYRRRGAQYRYYVPSRGRYGPDTSPADRYRASELEESVIVALRGCGYIISPDGKPGALTGVIRRIVHRIEIKDERLTITTATGALIDAAPAGQVAATARTRPA